MIDAYDGWGRLRFIEEIEASRAFARDLVIENSELQERAALLQGVVAIVFNEVNENRWGPLSDQAIAALEAGQALNPLTLTLPSGTLVAGEPLRLKASWRLGDDDENLT